MNEPTYYTCACCGKQFETEWSEEEAQAEKRALWGDIPDDACNVVCDDCFRDIVPITAAA